MRKTMKYPFLFLVSVIFFLFVAADNLYSQPFTIVIDAGHGGHDTGAVGKFSKEKNLNLAISLLFGKMVEDNHPDVKVVYTRKSDIFLQLQERADIVNKNNADVFFCIHTNANNSAAARGTETYTLRVNSSRTQGNLEVAMRENSVILLEDDYKTRYQGFDPRSVDSYIMFDFMQDKYMDKSVRLASAIQKQFVRAGRFDRGVQQAGFWVLFKSACPSVLIEMGFISNTAEEIYLNSSEGQKEIASAIYNAFLSYKKDHDKKSGKYSGKANASSNTEQNQRMPKEDSVKEIIPATRNNTIPENIPASALKANVETAKKEIIPAPVQKNKDEIVYKVQILVLKSKAGKNDPELKGLQDTQYYMDQGLYKYTYGECSTLEEANRLKKKIEKKFPYSFVVAFKNGKRVIEK